MYYSFALPTINETASDPTCDHPRGSLNPKARSELGVQVFGVETNSRNVKKKSDMS